MITESDLYSMTMESETAYKHAQELCKALGYPFPPKLEPRTAKREIPDPFTRNSNEQNSSVVH